MSHETTAGLIRFGVAGWGIPISLRLAPQEKVPVLAHYAQRFDVVEINTTFARPHRPATYERWTREVPKNFRFCLKLPRRISHELRLCDVDSASSEFIEGARCLGEHLGCYLLQLPPSFEFDERSTRHFLEYWHERSATTLVIEARHPSWFTPAADDALRSVKAHRVWADPAPRDCPRPDVIHDDFAYVRLHGTPRVYYSAYTSAQRSRICALLLARPPAAQTWCIFDNTALGAAWTDVLAVAAEYRRLTGGR